LVMFVVSTRMNWKIFSFLINWFKYYFHIYY
jgi:hypothetical protein